MSTVISLVLPSFQKVGKMAPGTHVLISVRMAYWPVMRFIFQRSSLSS